MNLQLSRNLSSKSSPHVVPHTFVMADFIYPSVTVSNTVAVRKPGV